MRKLTRLLQLDRAQQWLLIQSMVLLPLVALLLRTIGLARSWALLRRAAGRSSPVPVVRGPSVCEDASPQAPSGGLQPPDDTVRMVDVAARHLPWQPTCLPRSLVLWFLLRRQGVPAELRIGVQRSEQQLEAHAWVEVDHRVVNDTPDIAARFPPFESIAAALRIPS